MAKTMVSGEGFPNKSIDMTPSVKQRTVHRAAMRGAPKQRALLKALHVDRPREAI